jgi:hypothetical protein
MHIRSVLGFTSLVLTSAAFASDSPFDTYNIDWVREDDGTSNVLRPPVLDIAANIDDVWAAVTDINRYVDLSGGAVEAHVDGEPDIGKTISFRVHVNFRSHFMGTSHETIIVNDPTLKVIGWSRAIPMSGARTERYHVLEAIGPNLTRSYIGLKMPGRLGRMAEMLFGSTILQAFEALHEGIKAQAIRNSPSTLAP